MNVEHCASQVRYIIMNHSLLDLELIRQDRHTCYLNLIVYYNIIIIYVCVIFVFRGTGCSY